MRRLSTFKSSVASKNAVMAVGEGPPEEPSLVMSATLMATWLETVRTMYN